MHISPPAQHACLAGYSCLLPCVCVQEVPGQAASFVEHIRLGVKEAAADPEALLLFSGGKTRRWARGGRVPLVGCWCRCRGRWNGDQGGRLLGAR